MLSKLEEDLEAAKVVIRSLLIADKRALTVKQLICAYQKSEGQVFPFKHFGFRDALSFLRSIPDTVCVVLSGAEFYVGATVTDAAAHVDKLVRHQRNSSRRSRSPPGKHSSQHVRPAFAHLPAPAGPALTTLERVKTNLIELLAKNLTNGLDVRELEELYINYFGVDIGYNRFGYRTLEDFLIGATDVVTISRTPTGVRKVLLRNGAAQQASSSIQPADMTPSQGTAYSYRMADSPELQEEEDWDAEIMAKTSVRGTQLQPSSVTALTHNSQCTPLQCSNSVQTSVQGIGTELQPSPLIKHTNSVQTSDQGIHTQLQSSQAITSTQSSCILPECTNGAQTTFSKGTDGVKASRSGLNPRLRQDIQQVLVKNADGLWLSHFASAYEEVTGHELELSEHGFSSLLQLMGKCTDILYITRPIAYGDFMVCPHKHDKTLDTKMVATIEMVLRSSGPQGLTVDELLETCEVKTGTRICPSDLGFTRDAFVVFLAGNAHITFESLGRGQYVMKWHDNIEEAARIKASSAATASFKRTAKGTLTDQTAHVDHDQTAHVDHDQTSHVDHAFERALAEAQATFEHFSTPPLDLPMSPFKQQEVLLDRRYQAVYVSHIYHVHHFYLQLEGAATSHCLEKLMIEMEVYNSNFAEDKIDAKQQVYVGMPCAVPYTYSDGASEWHRGLVIAMSTFYPVCQVLYVDHGTLRVLQNRELRILRDEFFDLPAQAIRAAMSHLAPIPSSGWTLESKAAFIKLAAVDHALMCLVLKKEGPVYDVSLCDTVVEPEVHIADFLVDEGYARPFKEYAVGTMDSRKSSSAPRAESAEKMSPFVNSAQQICEPVAPRPVLCEHPSLCIHSGRHSSTAHLAQPGSYASAAHCAGPACRMPCFESETARACQATKKDRRHSYKEATEQGEGTKRSMETNRQARKDRQARKASQAKKTGRMSAHSCNEVARQGCSSEATDKGSTRVKQVFSSEANDKGSTSKQLWAYGTPQKGSVNGQVQGTNSSKTNGQAHMFDQFCAPSQAETPDRCHSASPMQTVPDMSIQLPVQIRVPQETKPMHNWIDQHKENCQAMATKSVWTEGCCQPTLQTKTLGTQNVPLAQASTVPPVYQKSATPVEPFVESFVGPAASALKTSMPVSNTPCLQSLHQTCTKQLMHAHVQSATSSSGKPSPIFTPTSAQPSVQALHCSNESSTAPTAGQQPEGAEIQPAGQSCDDGEEDFMVILKRELDGPLLPRSVKPEYLKTGHCLMVLNHVQEPYVSSANVCQLLEWTSDEILQQLEEKCIEFPVWVLRRDQNIVLFNQMASYGVPGVKVHEQLLEQVSFFLLKNVIDLLNLFECPSKRLRQEVTRVFNSFDPTSEYWRCVSNESDTEDLSPLEEELERLRARRRELHIQVMKANVVGKIVDELTRIEEKIAKVQKLSAHKGTRPSLARSKKSKH